MSKRTSLDINNEILELCRTPQKRTNIVYKANLNFKIVKKYLDNLVDNQLLKYDGRFYYTSLRGINVIDSISKISHIIELVNI